MASEKNDHGGRVLATLNADGSRRWLRPRPAPGRFLTGRRIVAYGLILLFTVLPYIKMNGKPVFLINIPERELNLFGETFRPTDTILMALLMMILFFTIFLVTALFGRVWCGWACPQTVYMEFLYRPIERLLEGVPGKKRKIQKAQGARKALKYVLYLLASLFLAHTFLAYFVGVETLYAWMRQSPLEHPTAFIVVMVTTVLMLLDFGYFREQVCLVMCPYGRIQAAMLDRHSLIVTYDEQRGEPRGKKRRPKNADGDVALDVVQEQGDCIDCQMCVTTCPTGIDIRNGLQMECIGCAQCIDACDAVMEKIGRAKGLIRYSSQAIISGKAKSIIRPRLFFYPLVVLAVATLFGVMVANQQSAEAQLLPRQGATFYTLDTGEISNQARIRITNRGDGASMYTIGVEGEAARLIIDENPREIAANEMEIVGFQVVLPADAFSARGKYDAVLTVTGDDGFATRLFYDVQGPAGGRRATEGGLE